MKAKEPSTYYPLEVVARLYGVARERIRQLLPKAEITPGRYGLTLDQVKQLIAYRPIDLHIGSYEELCNALRGDENGR